MKIGIEEAGHAVTECRTTGESIGRLLAWISTAWLRTQGRRALAELDDRLLRDIGITREAARTESARPFWR